MEDFDEDGVGQAVAQFGDEGGALVGVELDPADAGGAGEAGELVGVVEEGDQDGFQAQADGGGGEVGEVLFGEFGGAAGHAVPQAHQGGAGFGEEGEVGAGAGPAHLEVAGPRGRQRAGRGGGGHLPSPSMAAMRLYWISLLPE